MFNNHIQLLLVLSLVVIVAIILYNGVRLIESCRELGSCSLTASLSDQLWEKIGIVRAQITELKAQFDACAGQREIGMTPSERTFETPLMLSRNSIRQRHSRNISTLRNLPVIASID